jgi:hypothetical protein
MHGIHTAYTHVLTCVMLAGCMAGQGGGDISNVTRGKGGGMKLTIFKMRGNIFINLQRDFSECDEYGHNGRLILRNITI